MIRKPSFGRRKVAAPATKSQPQMLIDARLRVADGREARTLVSRLSDKGFSAAVPDPVAEGQECWLTLPGLDPQAARVVAWHNATVRCTFATPLPAMAYAALVERFLPRAIALAERPRML